MRTLILITLLASACHVHCATVTADFPGHTLGAFHPRSPGITFDFWLHNDTKYGEKWGNASILTLNLHDPNLNALMKGLAPGMIRIGGSPVDSVVYDVGGCTPGGSGPSSTYYCSQVQPYVYGCLTKERWTDVLTWAKELGMQILMGINACYGRTGADEPMDFSNIKAFMEATKSLGDSLLEPLIGFEFGNEVTRTGSPTANYGMIPSRWAKDAAVVKQIIDATFGSGRMVLAGPADNTGAVTMVGYYVQPGVLDIATYHQYPECEGTSTNALSPSCLQQVTDTANVIATNITGAKKGIITWAGETADHVEGGIPGLNDVFQDVFYYAWQLGALPANNVPMALRQCMVGGDYELVDRNTFLPNPDYFIAAMFKVMNVSGGAAQAVTVSPPVSTTGLQVFGFVTTAKENAAVIINTGLQDAYTVSLEGAGWKPSVSAWHFTSPNITSKAIHLNNMPLVYPGNGAPVPAMNPVTQTTPLAVAPASVVFVKNL
eukprot:TRINITY_DN25614_c0_g1_i1.p1 TRINITY_DN25614_c0_g1~~TRINITY_DN25614_c0_g1_i1.p1  ORF type:complete len:500 (+),score=166.65 TRINITY_DN25614_c0_g1_i1:33-1502(+)